MYEKYSHLNLKHLKMVFAHREKSYCYIRPTILECNELKVCSV